MLCLKLATVLVSISGALALWPIPTSLQTGNTTIKLSAGFKITVNLPRAPSDLHDAIERTASFLRNDKLGRLVVGRGESDRTQVQKAKRLSTLTLSLEHGATTRSISEESMLPIGTRLEGYSLHLPSDGSPASLTANSTLGLLRGLTTFEQLWYALDDDIYTLEAPVSITDSPAYVSLTLDPPGVKLRY